MQYFTMGKIERAESRRSRYREASKIFEVAALPYAFIPRLYGRDPAILYAFNQENDQKD